MSWPQENAKIAKKKRHKFFSLSSLHCTPSESLIFAKILPRISRINPRRPNQFPIRGIREIRGSIPFGCGWPRCGVLRRYFFIFSPFIWFHLPSSGFISLHWKGV
jgi:hypothetical protein